MQESRKSTNSKYTKEHLLFEMYRMRGLTTHQLGRSIFNSYDYAYEYTKRLEIEGLIQGKIYNAGQKRLGKLMTVTDKGIEMLVRKNLLSSPAPSLANEHRPLEAARTDVINGKKNAGVASFVRFAKPKEMKAYANNQQYDKHKAIYTLLNNELYAEITRHGMYYFDSREWKNRYNLNRNALTRGGFKALDGQEYSIYALFSKEHIKSANVSDAMLERLVDEITSDVQSGKQIIYVFEDKEYDNYIQKLTGNRKFYSGDTHIIRHNKGEGFKLLLLLSDIGQLTDQLSLQLNIELSPIRNDVFASRFCDYTSIINGEPYYVLNYLVKSENKLIRLKNEFSNERSDKEGRKMAILAWESDKEKLESMFKNSRHVRVRYIADERLDDYSYVEKQLLFEAETVKEIE